MKKRDLYIIVLLMAVALTGLLLSRPGLLANGEANFAAEDEKKGQVVIYAGALEYKRIDLKEPQTLVIDQKDKYNEISISNRGVVMKSSNCESQDCIHQGEVTVDNIESRALGSWIICLPNGISIELVKGEVQ